MLSDRERRALREVESQLTAQDPDFTRSFDTVRHPSTFSIQWIYGLPSWVYRLVIGLAVALGFLMMISRAPWTGILFVGIAVLFWRIQNRRSEPGRETR